MEGGGWGFPQLPAERNGGVCSRPFAPTPRGRAPGVPPFISSLRTSPERSGAPTWPTAPGVPRLSPLRHAWPPPSRPPIPGAPVASAQSPVPVPVDPALRPLPSATRRRFPPPLTQPGSSPPRLPPAPSHFSRLPRPPDPAGPSLSLWPPPSHPGSRTPRWTATFPSTAPLPPTWSSPLDPAEPPPARPSLFGVVAAGGGAARRPQRAWQALPALLCRPPFPGGGVGAAAAAAAAAEPGPLLLPRSPGLLPRPPARFLSHGRSDASSARVPLAQPRGSLRKFPGPRAPLARLAVRGFTRRRARHALGQTKGLQGRPRRREPLGEGRSPVGRRG